MSYSVGRTTSVRSVDVTMPPMTTVASGRCTSAPVPCDSAIGRNPMAATSAVISTGFRRSAAPAMVASRMPRPSRSRSARMAASMTTPLSTATPKSAMNPIDADRFSVMPRIHRAAIPPTAANGTLVRISSAQRTRPNVTIRSRKMMTSDNGTTSARRAVARSWFSNCPPHVT